MSTDADRRDHDAAHHHEQRGQSPPHRDDAPGDATADTPDDAPEATHPDSDRPQAHTNGSPARARVLAFMNQKGGVGKTTTVVNLAAALAEAGRNVLVVDLDPQAHATLHLDRVEDDDDDNENAQPADETDDGAPHVEADAPNAPHAPDPADAEEAPDADDELSVYDVLLETAAVSPDGVATRDAVTTRALPSDGAGRLDLLPAVTDLAAAETELATAERRLERLRLALRDVAHDYDYVLLDCPPSLGLLTLNALAAADEVVVPMQSHFLALQGVGKLLETVSLVAADINPRLRVAGVVLTQHDEQTRHGKEVVANLESFFTDAAQAGVAWSEAKIYRPAVRRNIKLAESPSFGMTIFEYDAACAGAHDYRNLARSFIDEEPTWRTRFAAELHEHKPLAEPSSNGSAPHSDQHSDQNEHHAAAATAADQQHHHHDLHGDPA